MSRCPNRLLDRLARRPADRPAAAPAHHRARPGGRRRDRQPALRRAAAALRRGPAQRHQPLHQLTRRLGLGRAGHLRHDAADPQRRQHPGDGTGRQHGPVPALGRHAGQALRPAALPGADAPGLRRHRRHGRRHRDPGREPRAHQERDDAADRRAHRPVGGEGRAGRRLATAGSPPRRRASTASSTRSSATSPRSRPPGRRAPSVWGYGDEQLHDPQRRSRRPCTASGPWTSTAGCSPTGSSTSAPRSTTASPTSSSRSCCTWSRSVPRAPINLYLNSPGGSVTATLAIYDTMQFVSSPVSTTCVGQAASSAALLLAGGTPGSRMVLPHARVVLHQPSTGGQGALPDLALQAKEIVRLRAEMESILARHTGQSVARLREDTDRDLVLDAAGGRRLRPGRRDPGQPEGIRACLRRAECTSAAAARGCRRHERTSRRVHRRPARQPRPARAGGGPADAGAAQRHQWCRGVDRGAGAVAPGQRRRDLDLPMLEAAIAGTATPEGRTRPSGTGGTPWSRPTRQPVSSSTTSGSSRRWRG